MLNTLLLFLLSAFLAFYVPGQVLLRKLKLSVFEEIVLSTTIGISLWAWQGFVFGFLNIRWATYIYLLTFFIIWTGRAKLKKPKLKFKPDWIIILIILVGTIIQSSIVWSTGINTPKGIIFCCGDTSADIYHLGLTYSLIQHILPFDSEMANTIVTNYHYLSNLTVAELVRIFNLPLADTEFRLMAPLISLLLGLLAICFSKALSLSKEFTRFLLFLLYLSGDFLYLIQLLFRHSVNFTFGPLENATSFLENPPRAFAVVVFLAGLVLLVNFIKKKRFTTGVLIAFLFASAIGFKVYIGIFALTGLFFVAFYYLLKKQKEYFILFLATLILSLIIYLPVNSGSGGLYFIGFWRFEEFGIQPLSGLNNLVLALATYKEQHNNLHFLFNELLLFLLFVFGEFGTKLIGFFQNKKTLSLFPKELNIFLISALFVNFAVGMFFQQNAGGSNSFNFLVSVYIIGSIYAALASAQIFKKLKHPLKYVFLLIIVLLNIPRIWYSFKTNVNLMSSDTYTVSNNAIEALTFLDRHTPPDSIILSNYSPYLNYIAKRQIFLNNYGILESHTIDTSKRRQVVKTVLISSDEKEVKEILYKNNISYLYFSKSQPFATEKTFKQVFSNEDVKIFATEK